MLKTTHKEGGGPLTLSWGIKIYTLTCSYVLQLGKGTLCIKYLAARNERSYLKTGEFLLWYNRINCVVEALGCRFDPQPGTVGEGSGIATAAAQVTIAAQIWSLVQEVHMPWGGQWNKVIKTCWKAECFSMTAPFGICSLLHSGGKVSAHTSWTHSNSTSSASLEAIIQHHHG